MLYSSRKRRSGGPRRSFRRSPNNRKNTGGSKIDPSRYVHAAIEPVQEEAYQPQHTFDDFGFEPQLVKNVRERGFTSPTPIQDQAIPELMAGKDVVGIANTGTGKTAAFLLPLINSILLDNEQGALILAPTRELALQIFEELQAFAAHTPIGVALCIGGANMGKQISRLKNDPHFVIATPGRIKDLLQRGHFKPELYTNIVLDEVDRMLDIGFRKDILYLISQLPENRHAALFSATLSNDTQTIARRFLHNPVTIELKKRETSHHVEQDVVRIKLGQSKVDVLHNLLSQDAFEKVIVFGKTKRGINKLEQQLSKRQIRVSAIHGNKSQNARQRALQEFKQGKVTALLATDVAARGIDIDDVTHVINYDEPQTYQDYVHRIGRTGRAGKLGKALTFIG